MDSIQEKTKMEGYEKRSQSIISLIDKLRDEGASFDIDLPTVVFCGNQSAGKSSLIESISGVRLPRSEGTCTRCPMELRLQEDSQEWKCSIVLQFKYKKDGKKLKEPWNYVFSEEITDIDEVELAVRRAQKAILNPSSKPIKYQEYEFDDSTIDSRREDAKKNELNFTNNVVCLKISGARANLTLVDLPGIIKTTENSSESQSITLVENLVKTYIKNPKSLIVATISCKDEMENQAIISLAQQFDPKGERTIGVLTKPDTIENSCHDTWLQILNNRRFKLKHGYYIVKSPNKEALENGITFDEARENERQFFNKTAPWSVCPKSLQNRMGVNFLRESLSRVLTKMIEESLPSMKRKVEQLIDVVSKELSSLPSQITQNPKLELIDRIKCYGNAIKSSIALSKNGDNDLFKKIDQHLVDFFDELTAFSPRLKTELKEDSEDPSDEDYDFYADSGISSENTSENNNSLFTHDKIRAMLGREKITKDSDFLNFVKKSVIPEIITECQTQWHESTISCINSIKFELLNMVSNHSKGSFGRFQILSNKVEAKTKELISQMIEKTNEMVKFACELELENFNAASWETEQAQPENGFYNQSLPFNGGGAMILFKNNDSEGIKNCFLKLILNKLYISSNNLVGPVVLGDIDSQVQMIMEIAGECYRIQQGRFGYHVCKIIYKSLVMKLAGNIESHLIDSLGVLVDDKDNISCLIEESSETSCKRSELNSRLSRLRSARRSILGSSN